jgi:hypothetical protein
VTESNKNNKLQIGPNKTQFTVPVHHIHLWAPQLGTELTNYAWVQFETAESCIAIMSINVNTSISIFYEHNS